MQTVHNVCEGRFKIARCTQTLLYNEFLYSKYNLIKKFKNFSQWASEFLELCIIIIKKKFNFYNNFIIVNYISLIIL